MTDTPKALPDVEGLVWFKRDPLTGNFVSADPYAERDPLATLPALQSLARENAELREAAQFALDELAYMPRSLAQWCGGMGKKISAVRKRLRAALNRSNGNGRQ